MDFKTDRLFCASVHFFISSRKSFHRPLQLFLILTGHLLLTHYTFQIHSGFVIVPYRHISSNFCSINKYKKNVWLNRYVWFKAIGNCQRTSCSHFPIFKMMRVSVCALLGVCVCVCVFVFWVSYCIVRDGERWLHGMCKWEW